MTQLSPDATTDAWLARSRDVVHRTALAPQAETVGVVEHVADGIALVSGLPEVRLNELLRFDGGRLGFALTLDADFIATVLLDDSDAIESGSRVTGTGEVVRVPVGPGLLGRVVDPLGRPLDRNEPVTAEAHLPVERPAPGIIERDLVSQPVETGILIVDALFAIGRGQRELIIGDRATGKTAIAIDTIINQARLNKAAEEGKIKNHKPLYCIYVGVGQKNMSIARTVDILEKAGALPYTIVVSAPAAESATNLYLAPYSGAAMGEWFMDNGMDALIVFDDLTKHAAAYRQVSLILKRPSGREAYPGDVFYLHSRLLERSARLNEKHGGGSLTALPVIETQAGDVSAYIPTNVISITDGQIYLETDLFYQGVRPAISVGISVSRVGSAAQIKAIKQVAGSTKLDLAQFRDLQAFAQFGSDVDAGTRKKLERGQRIVELFKQTQYNPYAVEIEVVILFAMQKGYFDDVPVDKVKNCQAKLVEYFQTRKVDLLTDIIEKRAIDKDLEEKLHAAIKDFKGFYRP